MKKPTAVKIVEALGWVYVALAALAGLRMVYDVVRLGCGASAVVESVFYLLVLLALPLGMVLSLRNGRRVWFLCSHWVAVGLFLCIAIIIAVTNNDAGVSVDI